MITPPFLLLFWTINTFAILASRLLVRRALAQVRKHGRNLRCIVILGTNTRALEFARRLRAKPEWGYRNLGFIDEPWHGLKEFRRTGQTLLCSFSGLAEFLRNTIVDEVAIYLPLRSFHAQASDIAGLCAQHGITVRYDSDIFGMNRGPGPIEAFDADPYLAIYHEGHYAWSPIFKPLFHISGSLPLLFIPCSL